MGKPIQWGVKAVSRPFVGAARAERLAHDAVHFRPSYHFHVDNKNIRGRTLGAEVAGVTTGFFGMGVGNAMAQDVVSWFDPNDKKDWLEKGHFKPVEAVKSFGRAWWNYITYRGGEDWAVAVPYVYFMKGLTPVINKFSPGWNLAAHANAYGFKVDDKGKVTGNYAKEATADFFARFTVYNWFTLMYRELYQYGANIFHGRPYGLYGSPDSPEQSTMLGTASDIGKWVLRSTIKGTLFMLPASPIFALIRPTQNKDTGHFINSELGRMVHKNKKGYFEPIKANSRDPEKADRMRGREELLWSKYDPQGTLGKESFPFERRNAGLVREIHPGRFEKPEGIIANPDSEYHPFKMGQSRLGQASDWFSRKQNKAVKFVQRIFPDKGKEFFERCFSKTGNDFLDKTVKASVAYTPYFIAKDMATRYVDNARTDMGIETMIDGTLGLDWTKFRAGAMDVYYALTTQHLPDPAREAEAERRVKLGKMTLEEFTQGGGSDEIRPRWKETGNGPSWQERMVKGKTVGSDGASLDDKYKVARTDIQQKPSDYRNQEEMRKLLRESAPPTNSVH
ncbi:MAG: hypothetical protein KGJ06_03730 [Pseudomonadota bacterium]|nr:hypothetical protein [Pseudomonadota bacterium]